MSGHMDESGKVLIGRFGAKKARPPLPAEINRLSGRIVNAAFQVHKAIGPGLLESVYEACLAAELRYQGIEFQRQVGIDVRYRDINLESGLRLDFLIGGLIVVELKAVELVLPVHSAQLASYLRLANKQLGLLINFNFPVIREGITRIVNPQYSASLSL